MLTVKHSGEKGARKVRHKPHWRLAQWAVDQRKCRWILPWECRPNTANPSPWERKFRILQRNQFIAEIVYAIHQKRWNSPLFSFENLKSQRESILHHAVSTAMVTLAPWITFIHPTDRNHGDIKQALEGKQWGYNTDIREKRTLPCDDGFHESAILVPSH